MDIILSHAHLSFQTVQSIICSHVFKNQFFLGAILMAFYLVFRGGFSNLMDSYIVEIFYFYNFLFTLAPLVYQFAVRNKQFVEKDAGK